MTTKTDTEQLRTEFEAWIREWKPDLSLKRYADARYMVTSVHYAWEAYQASRAALQSQDREDAERIQFMADEACTFNTWKQEDGSWKYRLEWDHGTEWQTEWFSTPEEAIDHARSV